MQLVVFVIAVSFCFAQGQRCYDVSIEWGNTVQVSKTITTLQVVANPILNPKTSPVAKRAWQSLAELKADLVRYVPWFPYPKVGVAELDPPKDGKTFWNFDDIRPQLEAFMAATAGHSAIPNFSTQPTWMYNTNDWTYPADPNAVAWNYPRGGANANTTKLVSEYYGRLLSWMTKGSFVDEVGTHHVNGYHYPITHWEIFNEPEGCHGLNYQTYTQQFDAVVKQIRAVADPNKKIKFVGLALAGREMDWISYFLDHKNHDPAALPLDYISFHFYASCDSRTDPNSYEQFFPKADGFITEAKKILDIKNRLSPHTKLDVDEMGVILPNDNDANAPIPPSLYWNAAGAMYAYLFGNLGVLGYDVLGESQLAGSPPIPEWDIKFAQFPSVSMLNWTTGIGNARYWVLKLLLEHFKPGDHFVHTVVRGTPTSPICALVDGHNGYGNITITCAEKSATINAIQFSAFGTPTGTCGSYVHNPKCDAANVTKIVQNACLGQHSCSLSAYPEFGDPCYGVYKQFIIQATCSGSAGGFGVPPASGEITPYAQGLKVNEKKKILLVNKANAPACVNLSENGSPKKLGAIGYTYTVDNETGDGPARKDELLSLRVHLAPYAVAVVELL